MKLENRGLHQALIGAIALGLQACTGGAGTLPTPVVPAGNRPHLAIDAQRALGALANKPNQLWQDSAFNMPEVRQARQVQRAKYRTATAGVVWNLPLAAASSNAPAYAKIDNQNTTGPLPQTGDVMFSLTDSGIVQRIDPATKASTQVALGTAFSSTAVALSGDNKRLYLMATNGTFFVLDAKLLTTLWSGKISTAGFTGQMPFIDYSNGGGFPLGWDENVYALATDGSLYNVNVKFNGFTPTVAVHAYPSSNGTDVGTPLPTWTTQVNLPYGVAVTPGASPVVWNDDAYFGTTTGTCYRVAVNHLAPTTTPVVTSWSLAQYTSAPAPNGTAISAPCAIDFDNSLNVIAIFATCGDRLCWIDPVAGAVYDSPPLVVDKVPGFASQYQGALSSFPYTTSTNAYTANDWAAVAKTSVNPPTRWGSGGAVSGTFSTGISCNTIKKQPATGNVWVGLGTSLGTIEALTPAGTVGGGPWTSSANQSNEICFDPTGNCYNAHTGSPLIAKFNSAGTLLTSYSYPGGQNASWPESDPSGNLWVTSRAAASVTKFTPTGTVLFTNALASAFCVAVDATGAALVTQRKAAGTVVKYSPLGVVQGTYSVGSNPAYVAIEPTNNNIWTANQGSNTVSKLSPLGATVGTFTTPSQPWCIAFDPQGNPWVGCVGAATVVKLDATTGAVIASFGIPSGGQPYELAFDGSGVCWVSASNGTYQLRDLGNLSDLFATDSFQVSGDGDDSLAMFKFLIPKGSFGGKVPVGSTLTLTSATTPVVGATESYTVNRTSVNLASTTTPWIGWGGTIDVDYNNRPALYDPVTYSTLTATPSKDTSQTFTLGLRHATDNLNSTDALNAQFSYGLRATGKVLRDASHWYSNTTAPAAAQKPTLKVTLGSAATLPTTNGIQGWPCVDSVNGRVYVAGSNCVFELPYAAATPHNFSDATKVFYNLTKAGRTGGPVAAGKYVLPRANVMLNEVGDLFVADQDVSTSKIYLNRFSPKFYASPTTDHLAAFFDAAPGTGTLGQAMLFDYDKGSVYFTTSNSLLVRGTLY